MILVTIIVIVNNDSSNSNINTNNNVIVSGFATFAFFACSAVFVFFVCFDFSWHFSTFCALRTDSACVRRAKDSLSQIGFPQPAPPRPNPQPKYSKAV